QKHSTTLQMISSEGMQFFDMIESPVYNSYEKTSGVLGYFIILQIIVKWKKN
ncbi:MAG: hypothetical protein ACI86H_001874, partial [bacterium]